jgi:CAAX protease family protein
LPDESDPNLTTGLENQQAPDGSSPLKATPSAQPRGWRHPNRYRLFIWVAIAFLLPGAFVLAFHLAPDPSASVLTVQKELPVKVIMAFFVVLATWIVSRIEKRPLDDYGIPPKQAFGWRFWEGSVWGFAMLSTIPLVLCASGHFRVDSVALTGNAVFSYGFAWAVTFFAVSIHEEFAFRGYWLFFVAQRMRFWPAALFLSAVFGAAHLGNHGENALGIAQVVEIGLLFCLTIRRTGNLWFAVGFHAAWDWAETFFYGTPDSGLFGNGRLLNTSVQGPNWLTGGSAGPEGSVLALVILLLSALLIHFRFPKALYPDRPV